MAKGIQKNARTLYRDYKGYSSENVASDRNIQGISWQELDWRTDYFLNFITHYLDQIPTCWVRARQRYIYRITTATSHSDFNMLIEKIYLTYIAPKIGKSTYSDFYLWRSTQLLHPFGHWVLSTEMGIDKDIVDVVEI